jgi:hypothetical protein
MKLTMWLLPFAGLLLGPSIANASATQAPNSIVTSTKTITDTSVIEYRLPTQLYTATAPPHYLTYTAPPPPLPQALAPRLQPHLSPLDSRPFYYTLENKVVYKKFDIRGKVYDRAKFRDGNGLKDAMARHGIRYTWHFHWDSRGGWEYHADGHAGWFHAWWDIEKEIHEAGGCPETRCHRHSRSGFIRYDNIDPRTGQWFC